MKRTLVVLTMGQPPAEVAAKRGLYRDFIERAVGSAWGKSEGEVWADHDARVHAPLPLAESAAGFILTGSSSSVTERAPWMLNAEAWIRDVVAAGTPLFGICFGHQIIAQALGGEVARNPRGREVGTVVARSIAEDPVIDQGTWDVQTTHVDTVVRLPEGARVLAQTDLDEVAAFAIGDATRAVQFHPEFDADIMRGYLRVRSALLAGEGRDPEKLLHGVREAESATATLRRFVERIVR